MENEKSVQGTNDNSILSKCSMIKLGYFDDPLLHHFVIQKKSRRSPLINRGYYVRAKAIQFTLDTFLDTFQQDFQILSLGAGFDSLFFRLARTNKWPHNSIYCEVDFPDLVKRKRCLIVNSCDLMSLLRLKNVKIKNENVVLNSENYKLVGVDLRDTKKLKSVLEISGISMSKPTLVLLECVRTYLDVKSSLKLINWVREEFNTVVLASYEQMYCSDGFGIIMLNHFSSLGSPLLSIHPTSDLDSLKSFYLNLGWENVDITNMSSFYDSLIRDDEKRRVESIEPFDEYEEWHLKCNHYILVCAMKGLSDFNIPHISSNLNINRKQFTWKFCEDSSYTLQRFAHSSVVIDSQLISIGGFGIENGSHKRLNNISVINLAHGSGHYANIRNLDNLGARLYAQTIPLKSKNCIVVIGGRSSPIKPHENVVLLTSDVKNESINVAVVQCANTNPSPRWRHSASLVIIGDIENIVVFGGKSIGNEFLGDCFVLNTNTWTWKRIEENNLSPSPRHSHSSVTWMDNVLITCGLGISSTPLNSIHTLNCNNCTWGAVEVAGLLPRYSHTTHIWQDRLFLVGGVNCHPEGFPGIARISLDSWHCEEFSLPTCIKPVLLHNHSSVLDEENQRIIVLGGGGNCFSFGTHFNREIITIDVAQFC
uniref:tRNA wybutosine-synthesizing protein 4 n=1 Tax=Strigamia maritima TaxID=126957 RepID=T1JAC5_STRMM